MLDPETGSASATMASCCCTTRHDRLDPHWEVRNAPIVRLPTRFTHIENGTPESGKLDLRLPLGLHVFHQHEDLTTHYPALVRPGVLLQLYPVVRTSPVCLGISRASIMTLPRG
jgi:hypothetical protein